MKFTYRVSPQGADRYRNVNVEFTPYENEASFLNEHPIGWEIKGKYANKYLMDLSTNHPIIPDNEGSIIIAKKIEEEAPQPNRYGIVVDTLTISRDLELEPATEYLFSVYIRNEGSTTTTLKLNGQTKGSVVDTFTQRLVGIGTTDQNGKLTIEIDFMDVVVPGKTVAWIDGFMAVKTEEGDKDLRKDQLLDKYVFTKYMKSSPSTYDLLEKIFGFSPYRYYLVADNRRVIDYNRPLADQGIDENSNIETGEVETDEMMFRAFTEDIPLMAMLTGKRQNVSHAFPKEDEDMSNLHYSHFPRLQFFTGFAVNSVIADTKPFAEEVNFAINIYIPVSKVMESVNAIMIQTQLSAIMSELGWAKVRGSDYFLKNEQLYVMQGQYIQDLRIRGKRK